MSQEEHVASACRSRVNEQRAFPVTFGRNWITSFKQSLIRWSALWEIFPAIKLCCSCSKKHMKRCYLIYVWMNFPVILILILNINLLKWKTEIYFPATVSCFEDIPASWIFMRVMSHEFFAPPLSPQTFIHQTQIQCWCKFIFLRWWSSLTSSVLIGEREELMMHFYIKGAARPELKMCSLPPPQHDDGKFPQNISGTSL